MKNIITQNNRSMLLAMAALLSVSLFGGASLAQAHDGYQNRNGFYDHNGHYHQYGYHNNHRGYWNQHNGVRFWINIG